MDPSEHVLLKLNEKAYTALVIAERVSHTSSWLYGSGAPYDLVTKQEMGWEDFAEEKGPSSS